MLVESDKTAGETINIGSNTEISVGDTLQLIKELMSSNVAFCRDYQRKRPEKSEVFRLWCDTKKIEELVGYKPQVDIDVGLQKTIEWITKPSNLSKYKAEIYNV
jgi:nucleoside-diphosphate-sugar epimerase